MSDQHKVLNALLRNNLNIFIQKVFATVSPGDTYSSSWHLEAIAYHLALCASGQIKRLIITLPPRSLKSISASVAFPAWLLGHDPTRKIICASYAQDLAVKHSLDTRIVMEAEWYQRCFPYTQFSQDKNTQDEFKTTKLGYRLATSVGGTLTGRGGNFIIIDDPHKSDEVESDLKRGKVIHWFKTALLSRLNSKETDVIIVIQQRLHEEDLAGHLLDAGEWIHLNLPAIAEEDETIQIGQAKFQHRKTGEVLHPAKESLQSLERLKIEMGSYAFAAQYQQRPAPLGGGIIKWEWFKRYKADDFYSGRNYMVVQSWDTANDIGEMNDWSVCTTWHIKNNQYYLIDVLRQRLEYPALKQAVIAQAQRWEPNCILIEGMNSGKPLVQELSQTTRLNIIPIRPVNDKPTRMMEESPAIEAGRVFIPDSLPWLPEFQREMVQFPKGKFDDQVDSMSQFLRWVRLRQLIMQPLTCVITPY